MKPPVLARPPQGSLFLLSWPGVVQVPTGGGSVLAPAPGDVAGSSRSAPSSALSWGPSLSIQGDGGGVVVGTQNPKKGLGTSLVLWWTPCLSDVQGTVTPPRI